MAFSELYRKMKQGHPPPHLSKTTSWADTDKSGSLYDPYVSFPVEMYKKQAEDADITVGDVVRWAQKSKKSQKSPKAAGSSAAVQPFVPGRERISGYYGRYNMPGSSEEKFFDTAHTFAIDSTTEVPVTGQLCLIPQGTQENARVGRKVTIKSIHFRARVTQSVASNLQGAVYIAIVLDKQCNGAAASASDVIQGGDLGLGHINMANSERFSMLKRFTFTLPKTFNESGGVAQLDWYHKCSIPLEYSSTTGALTEIKSNNVFILACANVDDEIALIGTTRLRFDDS